MQLTEIALQALKTNRKCRNRLALELDVHSGTIDRHIKENEDNGELTKVAAVKIIAEETKIHEAKILTENK